MIFEDKLAVALLIWGMVFGFPGGMYWSVYESSNGKRVCLFGAGLAAAATCVWVFS